MDVLDISRWQFGIITVYHFLFVPLTIGLTLLIAIMETQWLRTKNEEWLRLTKFFGKLFLINFAIGVVTGIVQEFQFGMNWSDYSRFVGDIFGAPLAVEALLAFFMESVFIGLWIFGWDKLPPKLHAACMWMVHLGTLFSAYMILAANSWMQNPIGFRFNPETNRAELESVSAFFDVLFNKVQLITFPHVVLASYMTAGAFILGVAAWLYMRKEHDRPLYHRAIRFGAVATLIAGLGVAITGDIQGKIMTEVQPMKMAAAEALYESSDSCAPFSVFTIGTRDGSEAKYALEVPCVLSFLATGSFDGKVQGINELKEEYAAKDWAAEAGQAGQDSAFISKDTDFTPIIPVTYWSFRYMMGLGFFGAAGAALILWMTRKQRVPKAKWVGTLGLSLPLALVFASSWGWIFTEMGRQPWVVFGLMTTDAGVSPGLSTAEAWIGLISLTLLYAVLMVIEIGLLAKYIKLGADPFEEPPNVPVGGADDDAPMTFAY
jgi:cytochrome d ubiquinol oxidase subunit I